MDANGVEFHFYLDDRSIHPRIIMRIKTKTLDKGFPLTLEQARVLGGKLVDTANKASAAIIQKRGSIVGAI